MGNKFYSQVFIAVVHQQLVFFWVSALCSGWEFQWFGETYTLHLQVDSGSNVHSSISLNRLFFFQIIGTSNHHTPQKPPASSAINKNNFLSLLH
jgi:hypothetical protein